MELRYWQEGIYYSGAKGTYTKRASIRASVAYLSANPALQGAEQTHFSPGDCMGPARAHASQRAPLMAAVIKI